MLITEIFNGFKRPMACYRKVEQNNKEFKLKIAFPRMQDPHHILSYLNPHIPHIYFTIKKSEFNNDSVKNDCFISHIQFYSRLKSRPDTLETLRNHRTVRNEIKI